MALWPLCRWQDLAKPWTLEWGVYMSWSIDQYLRDVSGSGGTVCQIGQCNNLTSYLSFTCFATSKIDPDNLLIWHFVCPYSLEKDVSRAEKNFFQFKTLFFDRFVCTTIISDDVADWSIWPCSRLARLGVMHINTEYFFSREYVKSVPYFYRRQRFEYKNDTTRYK
jgi:hypothetical protein